MKNHVAIVLLPGFLKVMFLSEQELIQLLEKDLVVSWSKVSGVKHV